MHIPLGEAITRGVSIGPSSGYITVWWSGRVVDYYACKHAVPLGGANNDQHNNILFCDKLAFTYVGISALN